MCSKSFSVLNLATGFTPNTTIWKLQDYFGEAMCDTNACRMFGYGLAQAMDQATNNNDWTIHSDISLQPRYGRVTTNQIIDGKYGHKMQCEASFLRRCSSLAYPMYKSTLCYVIFLSHCTQHPFSYAVQCLRTKAEFFVFQRTGLLHWCWQLKFSTAKNVTHVSDKMMHACGGTGYKKELGRFSSNVE